MKNKKLLTAATSVALVAVVGVGATLAYFTDSEEQTNVVNMGHVDIDLTETSNSDNAVMIEDGIQFYDVMPGDIISKIPTITVAEGSQNAYVRMKMTISAPEGSEITQDDIYLLEGRLRSEITDNTGWYYSTEDGYYYYNAGLQAGQHVDFFDTVTIPAEWRNNTADETFTIELQAEAIQQDNVTVETDGNLITGWPEAEIQQYTE